MNKELTLLIPDSLLLQLELKAKEQGVSTEALCLSLLSGVQQEEGLMDPSYYQTLSYTGVKQEMKKVIQSPLSSGEVRKRLNRLEVEISRRYRVR
jgi:hypothetical protein